MKRITLYIGLMCLFAVWCTSCTNDNEGSIGDDIPILLLAQTMDDLQVRSTIADGQPLLQNMEVGVYISENGGANTSVGSNLHYQVNASGGLGWQGGNAQPYYPPSGRGVKISAYYPYNNSIADSYDFGVKSDQSSDDDYNASDLLYSTQASYIRQNTAHNLPFEHKLSRITYSLIAENGAPSLTGAIVSIVNVLPTTEFNRTTSTLSSAKGTNTTIVPNTSGAIVVPQTIASGTRLIKVSAGGNDYYYKPVSSLTLESGKSYDFEITVQGTELHATYTVSSWTNGTVNDNGGTVTAYTYRVGDYYPDPNVDLSNPTEKAKIKGIVYWLDPSSGGKHGKVIGLQENSSVQWSNSNSVTNATDMTNGRVNMKTIYDINNAFLGYPAFAWVHSLNSGSQDYSNTNATRVWYLPAKDEVSVLSSAYNTYGKSNFNAKLTAAGGTVLSNYWYWSSSELDGNSVGGIIIDNGITPSITKTSTSWVRCILAF